MCLLMVARPNATPTEQQLTCACQNNPDGFGYAIHLGDKIITKRSMDYIGLMDEFFADREKYPDTWAMFHARYTTHGKTNKSNCHPFRVGNSDKLILAHNGILPLKMPVTEHRSDTRFFAEEVLPRWGIELLDDPKRFAGVERWATGSKLVIFSALKKLEKPVYIINEKAGHWANDVWWSNDGYKHSYNWYSYKGSSKKLTYGYAPEYDDMSYDTFECGFCTHVVSEEAFMSGICDRCFSCLDCLQVQQDCLCYNPDNDYELQNEHAMTHEEWTQTSF
jgi:hypothetical protein